jgi:hypothetical protein
VRNVEPASELVQSPELRLSQKPLFSIPSPQAVNVALPVILGPFWSFA